MSRGFNFDSVKELAKLFVDHDFLTKDEADTFVSDIPVYNEKESEPQAEVTDQLLGDSSTDVGTLLPDRPSFDLASYVEPYAKHSSDRQYTITRGARYRFSRRESNNHSRSDSITVRLQTS